MVELLKEFFDKLPAEPIAKLWEEFLPWEPLIKLQAFLYDTISEVPKAFPKEVPFPEDYLFTMEGELIPLQRLEKIGDSFFFEDREVVGAIIKAGAYFSGRRFYLGPGTVIEPFSYLKEPIYLGAGVEVRHSAYLRGSVFACPGAVIGHSTEVKNSIFFPKAKAAHFAYVGDSILGQNVNLGAGTKLANLKFYRRQIVVKIRGKIYPTGLKKFGAILGDEVQTGCNSVLQPGTLVGKRSFIFPGVCAGSGFIPQESKIK